MIILLGQLIEDECDPVPALYIEEIGAFRSQTDDNGFGYVELDREAMVMLKDLLIRELSHEKANLQ